MTEMKQSRNGKKPVKILDGVTVEISGSTVKAKGPKGEISQTFRDEVVISQENGEILVRPAEGSGQKGLQFQGTTRAIISNMVEGVKNAYQKSLDFVGVGYRAEYNGGQRELKMTVGLSHQPIIKIPAEVSVSVKEVDTAGRKVPRVSLESVDKALVGRVAARIRSIRPPNPYGGKGVRYTGEQIRQKAGKSAAK